MAQMLGAYIGMAHGYDNENKEDKSDMIDWRSFNAAIRNKTNRRTDRYKPPPLLNEHERKPHPLYGSYAPPAPQWEMREKLHERNWMWEETLFLPDGVLNLPVASPDDGAPLTNPTTSQRIANAVRHLKGIAPSQLEILLYPSENHPTDPQLDKEHAVGVPPPTGMYVVLWSARQNTLAYKPKRVASWVEQKRAAAAPREKPVRRSRHYLCTLAVYPGDADPDFGLKAIEASKGPPPTGDAEEDAKAAAKAAQKRRDHEMRHGRPRITAKLVARGADELELPRIGAAEPMAVLESAEDLSARKKAERAEAINRQLKLM